MAVFRLNHRPENETAHPAAFRDATALVLVALAVAFAHDAGREVAASPTASSSATAAACWPESPGGVVLATDQVAGCRHAATASAPLGLACDG